MIYARISNNAIETRDDSWDSFDLQKTLAEGFTGFDVPGPEYLYIANGSIAVYTQAEVDANVAAEKDAELTAEAQALMQGFALVVLDQINRINTALNTTNAAINNATAGTANSTSLKTDYPQYTAQQMVNEVKAKL